ncbi:DsbA family protein [Patescibacteria group bacterium]|nr:DsbA family protein [Patescibacteria group bacterium]
MVNNFSTQQVDNPIINIKKPWYKKIVWWLVILLAIVWLGFSWLSQPNLSSETTESLSGSQASNLPPISQVKVISQDDPSLGPAYAPITIVEFGDFECPFCRQSYSIAKQLLEKYPDGLRLIYRDFPVSSIHPQALPAAQAANCAYQQNNFWPYHDKLFDRQNELGNSLYLNLATDLNLNMNNFKACLNDPKIVKEIEEDLAVGLKAGVQGTPAWFVNGRKVEGVLPLEVWEKLITAILKEDLKK